MNNEPEINYRATIIWDDMTTVVENGVEVSRVYQDNRIRLDLSKPCAGVEE
jgi:hypothetical protein